MASCSSSASSSSTTTPQVIRYDAFLSFRGEDTRDGFTSHLYAALMGKQILTFIDDRELRRGDQISPSLLRAIQQSKLSLIIFSENYASSGWCLDELAEILQCHKTNGQIVIPVFYRVDPSHVRYQTGSFADGFAKHEQRYQASKVQSWKAALKEAANLSGWDSWVIRPETKLIEKIVEDILEKLNRMSLASHSIQLVGIESRIMQVESLLYMESVGVRSVGLWGMGGIGKTTIVEAVFNHIYSQFEGHFLANVRDELTRGTVVALRSKLLSTVLDDESLNQETHGFRLNFIMERLRRRKVLIVLDDVDDSVLIQLQNFLDQQHDIFGPGSKILLTSRDRQVLRNLVDEVYEVEGLNHDEALRLFMFHAFKKKHPTIDYLELSKLVVSYANGNPLALKVLGSALFDKSKEAWVSALNNLQKVPKPGVMNVLKISYEGLSLEEKNIFLDIACLLRGQDRDYATKILDSYRSCVHFNIGNLIDKSLITVSYCNKLEMHDLLQEMAWSIVHEESTNPGKRSRLWDSTDIFDVLTKKKGTEAVEGICLDISKSREMYLEPDAFSGMNSIRFLKFHNPSSLAEKLHLPRKGLQYLSNELRYLCWDDFPCKFLPPKFCAQNLVGLELCNSKVKQLWTGVQDLVNLKRIDLAGSRNLIEIPNLSKAKNIESINLWGCQSLVELSSFVQHLNHLQSLTLTGCKNLISLPSRIDSKFLKVLFLGYCPRVKRCPEILGHLEVLQIERAYMELPNLISFKELRRLSLTGPNITKFPEVSWNVLNLCLKGTSIEQVPSSIGCLTRLEHLELSDNKKLLSLPSSICKLKSLVFLGLNNCQKLECFPEILEPMEALQDLLISNCQNLKFLPNSISHLSRLQVLDTSEIKEFQLSQLLGLPCLTELFLRSCYPLEIPNDLFRLSSLEILDLRDNDFESLSSSIKQLCNLTHLDLSGCNRLLSLLELPSSLCHLQANDCESLETIYFTENLKHVEFRNCMKLDQNARSNIMSLHHGNDVEILLPGSEIPEWFCYQNVGFSITIRVPLNCHQLKAVAFCIIFIYDKKPSVSPQPYLTPDTITLRCHVKANNGAHSDALYACAIDEGLFRSDHMLLWYTEDLHQLLSFAGNKASLEFSAIHWSDDDISGFKVKNCGLHLLYDEEFCVHDHDSQESMREDTNIMRGHDDYYSSNDTEPSDTRDGNSCFLCIESLRVLILDLHETWRRLWSMIF